MKIHQALFTAIAAATLVVAGCSKQSAETPGGTPSTPAASSVDTSKLSAAFETADAAAKSVVDSAVTAIKGADYSGAVTQLQGLAAKFKLTPEQQQAVNDVIANVQKIIADAAAKAADAAGKAAGDASKAVGDATKSLTK